MGECTDLFASKPDTETSQPGFSIRAAAFISRPGLFAHGVSDSTYWSVPHIDVNSFEN